MAPEFINDYKLNQCSFKLDVYAFGILLFMIINESNPFDKCSQEDIRSNAQNGKRPDFKNVDVDDNWKNLITKCWNHDPNLRPDFNEICDFIENDLTNASIDINAFNEYNQR